MPPKKVSWMSALSKYNTGRTFCHYKKGTPQHAEVKKIFENMKLAATVPKTTIKQVMRKTKKTTSLPSRRRRLSDTELEPEKQHQRNLDRVREMMRVAKLQRLKKVI